MSPLIAVPDYIGLAGLMRLHALYTGSSRREDVSSNRRA